MAGGLGGTAAAQEAAQAARSPRMLAGRQGARTGTVTAEALPAGCPGSSESPAWAGPARREPGAGSGGDGYKLQTMRSHRRN